MKNEAKKEDKVSLRIVVIEAEFEDGSMDGGVRECLFALGDILRGPVQTREANDGE